MSKIHLISENRKTSCNSPFMYTVKLTEEREKVTCTFCKQLMGMSTNLTNGRKKKELKMPDGRLIALRKSLYE